MAALLAASVLPFAVGQAVNPGGPVAFPVNASAVFTQTIGFMPKIVLIGDSITDFGFNASQRGWATQLQNELGGRAEVLNYGVGGATTRKADMTLERALTDLQYDWQSIKVVTIGFGANDAVITSPNWHQPLPKFKAHLVAMVNKLRSKGINNIIFITPPPVDRRRDRVMNATAAYAAAVGAVAQSLNLPWVDMFSAAQAVPDWQNTVLIYDGLHLTPEGQDLLYRIVSPAVAKFDLTVPNMPALEAQASFGEGDLGRLVESINRTAARGEALLVAVERSATQAAQLLGALDRTALQASSLLTHIEASADKATQVLTGELGHVGQRHIQVLLLVVAVLLAIWLITDKAPGLRGLRSGLLPSSSGAKGS